MYRLMSFYEFKRTSSDNFCVKAINSRNLNYFPYYINCSKYYIIYFIVFVLILKSVSFYRTKRQFDFHFGLML